MTTPPAENRQFTKIDDDSFWLSTMSSQQINVAALAAQLAGLCQTALSIGLILRAAAAAGVAKAAEVQAILDSVPAFSDEEAAAQFLAALQAIQDA